MRNRRRLEGDVEIYLKQIICEVLNWGEEGVASCC